MIPDFVTLRAARRSDAAVADPAATLGARGRLAFLVAAIAGRPLSIAPSRNGLVYTDGSTMYLPDESDIVALLTPVVAQAALLREGSLSAAIAVRLFGQEQLAARYLTLEAVRIAHREGALLPRHVQAQLCAALPGPVTVDAQESLQRATRGSFAPGAAQVLGVIRPLALLKEQGRRGGSAPAGSELRRAEQQIVQSDEDDEIDDTLQRSRLLSMLAGPVAGDNPISRILKTLSSAKTSKHSSEEQGGQLELAAGAVQWAKKISSAAKVIGTGLNISGWNQPDADGICYPEWDYLSTSYQQRCCHVFHYETELVARLDQGAPDHLLTRRLARLGTSHVRHRRQADGESLDNDALVSFVVDTASGDSGDERVYECRRKTGRDLSVLVLLDASGSTADQQSSGSSIWDSQRAVALNVVAALDGLGDSVAAYGFRSFGQTDVRFVRIKDFGERFSQAARARLHSLQPKGFTRLGAAVRHATHLLSTRAHTGNQLLVVVSDGLPYDIGYQETYAEQDVRRALAEAEAQDVGCVCLSIGSPRRQDALERVWGNVGHASLATVAELNRHAEPLLRAALARTKARGTGVRGACDEPAVQQRAREMRAGSLS